MAKVPEEPMITGSTIGSRLLGWLAVLTAVGVAVLGAYALLTKSRAESPLKSVTALKVGVTTEAEVQQLAEQHRRSLSSHSCEDGVCFTSFKVPNTWLSTLKLEPAAEFDANIHVKNGIVTSIHAALSRSMPIFPTFYASAGSVDEYDEIPQLMRSDAHVQFPTPVGKPYLRVMLDSHATAIQRERAFAFSFRCLVKPGGGCDLPCDYLPLAWQDWASSLRQSYFPQSDFDKLYPNNGSCRQ
jgi:hypothetical protein